MKCLNCKKNIEHKIPCIFCKSIFCSHKCLRSHIILSHHNNNLLINAHSRTNSNSNNKYTKQNKEKNDIIVQSPYLIEGIYYKQRNFDEKYKLENFLAVFDEDKPRVIGNGSFGQVFLVTNTINHKLYAIKHMIKRNLTKKLNSLDSIYKEIHIQSHIDHPNILPILYVEETSKDFDLVLEYAEGGSLFHYIRNRRYLDEKLAFSLFIQVVNAVYFLHKNDLIHRDIKPENILMFDNNTIKLCDFGWCAKLEGNQQRGTFCGTTEYMSPELVNHEEYSKEIDIWSLGVLLYEMVHGYSPFRPDKPNFNAMDVMDNIRMHRLKFNQNISQRCKDLIYHLLDEEPEKRYKIEDIFYSDFVKYYENKEFALPDKFLIEKYKYKISKAQNILYPKVKNDLNNYKRKIISHNKSTSNIKIPRSDLLKNDIEKEFNDNISIIEKNLIMLKNIRKKKLLSCTSEGNLDNFNNNKSKNKLNLKKFERNKTYEYFPSLTFIDNKINISLMGNSKSNNYSQYVNKSNNIINTNEHKFFNQSQENNEITQENEIPKNEAKIKTIIINNYFPNVLQNDEFNKNNEETKNDLTYKKNFRIKSLKMSKIPTNMKNNKIKINISKKKINSLIDLNYLMIKSPISPKMKIHNENKLINNLLRDKNNNNNESKIIEVNRTNYYSSKRTNETPCYNKINGNRKIYTRNINNCNYDAIKDKKYRSKDNYSNLNTNIINNNINANNKIYSSFYLNNNNNNKLTNGRIHHTKSMNLISLNFENENINSIFKSKDINKSGNILINSDKKLCQNNTNKNNRILDNNYNLNLYKIKKVNPNTYKTKPNSPINNYNNNFVHTILNRSKILEKTKRDNISLSNNISTYIYDFSNLKKENKTNNSTFNFEKEKLHNLEIPINKFRKLVINTNSFNGPNRNNKQIFLRKKIIETNKKIKNIPKVRTFKKNYELNINITNTNNISKNKLPKKCICTSNSNIYKLKNYSNRNILKYIKANNSNRIFNNEKLKLIKKLESNNLLVDKLKRMSNKKSQGNSIYNSANKKSENFINKTYCIEDNRPRYEKIKNNYKNSNIINKYPSSRNYKNYQEITNLKKPNSNSNNLISRTYLINLDDTNKLLSKRETKIMNTSSIRGFKIGINRVINDENNMNQLNLINKYKNNLRYDGVIPKKDNNISLLDKKDNIYCICHN